MDKDINTALEQWRQLLYNHDRAAADEFYVTHIVPYVAERVRMEFTKKYGRIIVSFGTTMEKIALLVEAVDANEYHFLLSAEEAAPIIDRLTTLTRLKPSQIRIHRLALHDPLNVHRVVRSIWEENKTAPTAVYISSGPAVTHISLATLARHFHFDILYQEWEKYDTNIKKADPLQRTIKQLDDPLEIYGDLELDKAVILFNRHKFLDALRIVEGIKQKALRIDYALFLETLARGYMAWQKFEFGAALTFLEHARGLSKVFEKEYERELQKNVEALRTLADAAPFLEKLKNPAYVVVFGYELKTRADFEAESKNYMLSVMFLYRCIDIFIQSELALHGMNPWSIDWKALPAPVIEKFDETWKKTTKSESARNARIGLMQGATLLKALEPGLPIPIDEIFEVTKFRNELLIEHGDQAGSDRQYRIIRKLAEALCASYVERHAVKETDPESLKFISLEPKRAESVK